jgi:subtilase family serine protease
MRKFGTLKVVLALSCASLFGGGAWAQTAAKVTQFGDDTFAIPACAMEVRPGFARCHMWVITDEAGNVKQFTDPAGLHPDQLRSAYRVKAQGKASTTIAIVDAFHYVNAESDLAVYRSNFGIPACASKTTHCFTQTDQNGGQNFGATNMGWNQEEALDLDMASAMCPKCKILAVEANTNSYNDLATAVNTAARLGAHVISNSYGGAEGGTQSFESSYDHAGVAVTASTGDAGYGAQFPATSPHVIAVGGTFLKADSSKRGWTETAWPGAGSGCSTIYAKPAWQTDPLCNKRMEADVSAVASPGSPVSVYGPVGGGSGWFTTGGTSVAAPLIGGIYGANGGKVNYGSQPYAHTKNLYDVTVGSNGSCGGTYFCTAGPGYDGPTGLGTPNGIKAFGDKKK